MLNDHLFCLGQMARHVETFRRQQLIGYFRLHCPISAENEKKI